MGRSRPARLLQRTVATNQRDLALRKTYSMAHRACLGSKIVTNFRIREVLE